MSNSRFLGCAAVALGLGIAGCGSAAQCPEGYVRVGELCNQLPVDAAMGDAAPRDAGPRLDGGTPTDGGSSDGAPVDTGVRDAGPLIEIDAATVDACVAVAETCNGLDDDCDGVADEDLKLLTFYDDLDGDGFGDDSAPGSGCVVPTGASGVAGDCDDSDLSRSPDATEICDGVDQNCDTVVDEGVTTTFYLDVDADGYGVGTGVSACTPPAGYTALVVGDCDDACGSCHPGGVEVCDGLDQDCASGIDNGVLLVFYADTDGDGFGNAAVTTAACSAPVGFVAMLGDCNDAAGAIHPGAAETCNYVDDNCVGGADEGLPVATYYVDADDDGYAANSAGSVSSCALPTGYTSRVPSGAGSIDCFPSEPRAFPGQTMYFATSIPGAPLLRAYDFNCDTVHSVRYSGGGSCSGIVPCTGTTGAFVGAAPACGAPGTFQISCALDATFTCRSVTDTRPQPCR